MPRSLTTICVLAALFGGCGTFIKGGVSWSGGIPSGYARGFQASTCTVIHDPDKPIAFRAKYFLLNDQAAPAFLEVDENGGNGTKFDNHWSDEANDYFFGYVKGSQGFLFTVPKDPAQPALRSVYQTISVGVFSARSGWDTTTGEDGVIRPTGNPSATCSLRVQTRGRGAE